MRRTTPILFVSHEGTLTGAPGMLLHFVRWLRDHSTVEPEIALLKGGPLAADFAEVGPTTVLDDVLGWNSPHRLEAFLASRGRHRSALRLERLRLRGLMAQLQTTRTVYLNSVASLRLLHPLPRAETAIAHVHELPSAMKWAMRPQDPDLLHTRVDHLVAAADCVADGLVQSQGIAGDRITRVYEFIDTARVLAPPRRDRAAIRAQLGLPADALVVGGSGFADWRKGIDLFVQMARAARLSGRDDIHFVWVGDRAGGSEATQLDFDIEQSGVGDHLHLVGLQPRSFDWYRAFDVFALTSREDPYPLVGLETGLLEVPMVCFAGSGGMTELVSRSPSEGAGESGVIVPYIDVEAMTRAVVELLDDPERRGAMGRRAAAVVSRDHEVNVAGPQLLEVIERVLGRGLT